jgi:hypothetical protein
MPPIPISRLYLARASAAGFHAAAGCLAPQVPIIRRCIYRALRILVFTQNSDKPPIPISRLYLARASAAGFHAATGCLTPQVPIIRRCIYRALRILVFTQNPDMPPIPISRLYLARASAAGFHAAAGCLAPQVPITQSHYVKNK